MPYSFTQIEKDKSKTIGLIFGFMILFYFAMIFGIALFIKNFLYVQQYPAYTYETIPFQFFSIPDSIFIFAVALIVAVLHWMYSTSGLLNKILFALNAHTLDGNDKYHQMFANIIEEVCVATGGTKITGVVIPSSAMNAFALCDTGGRAVIGVTEGVLARLTRAQIESVVAHEAAHIVSGDCVDTTITSSLFELYGSLLSGIGNSLRFTGGRSRRGGGGAIVIILVIYLALIVMRGASYLLRMFVSREREYRADSIAVRLTRNPLALAEALYAIGYHWRGAGLPAEELEAIFISNPKPSFLDEKDSLWAELFSTHPPLDKRIGVLLDMAHTEAQVVIDAVKNQDNRPRVTPPTAKSDNSQWMANKEGKWAGPFNLNDLKTLSWLRPDTWIQRLGEKQVKRGSEDTLIANIFVNEQEKVIKKNHCPKCVASLKALDYEGVEVLQCPLCCGVLVSETGVQKILLRREVGFSERITHLAELLKKPENYNSKCKIPQKADLLKCPHCAEDYRHMIRMFYTSVYRVMVDRCNACRSIWFDRDELEVLQCLLEGSIS